MSDQKTLTEWPPVGIEIPEPDSYMVQYLADDHYLHSFEWAPGDFDVPPDIEPMLLPTPVADDNGGYLVPPESIGAIQAHLAIGDSFIRFTVAQLAQCTPGRLNLTMANTKETIRDLTLRAFGVPAEYFE